MANNNALVAIMINTIINILLSLAFGIVEIISFREIYAKLRMQPVITQ
jgi:hypothetical protein